MSPLARDILDSMRTPEPVTFADLTDALVAILFSVGLVFFAGWTTKEIWDEQEAERIAALPKRVIERPQPKPIFACHDRVEWDRMCKGRRRSI